MTCGRGRQTGVATMFGLVLVREIQGVLGEGDGFNPGVRKRQDMRGFHLICQDEGMKKQGSHVVIMPDVRPRR